MQRQLEPELMEDPAQVKAYAEADFELAHNSFIECINRLMDRPNFSGTALELGCGPGDISRRFAKAFPNCCIDAVDGSREMIDYANKLTIPTKLKVNFIHGKLPDVIMPKQNYDIIFSNSLLHHLPNPQILWQTVKTYTSVDSHIGIMDLLRPDSTSAAQDLVARYAHEEPDILQRDFYHSLLAAFTLPEIQGQLKASGLNLNLEQISDRHVFIYGIIH